MGFSPRSEDTRNRIAAAARRLFATEGYERTTIRAVAAAAQIHPSMVMRYFDSKEGLFAAAAIIDLAMPDMSGTPKSRVGETLVRHFLDRWEGDRAGDELPSLLRAAVTHEAARQRLCSIFSDQLVPALKKFSPGKDLRGRAALVSTQLLGLAFTRYVIRLPAVTDLPPEVFIKSLGRTVNAYLQEEPKSDRAK
jgi:AcrR family transcriptional regulator